MSDIKLTLVLPAGGSQSAQVPDDVPMREVVPELVASLHLPTAGPDGRPMNYRLTSKALGRELHDDETLADAGVLDNDQLTLIADVAAQTFAPPPPRSKSPAPAVSRTPSPAAPSSAEPTLLESYPWLPVVGAILALCLLATCIVGIFSLRGNNAAAIPTPTTAPAAVPTTAPAAAVPTTAPIVAAAASASYPLVGQTYSSPQGSKYNAVWTSDGRLWQPQLPPGADRIAHTVGFTIEEGNYAFDGVECQLFVDTARNGKGASNPVTAEYGNDLRFSVSTADHGQAWALVQCRGNASSRFQIRWLGR